MIYNGVDFDTYFKNYPDADGYFGKYGGAYVSDDLKNAMKDITEAYFAASAGNSRADRPRSPTSNAFPPSSATYSSM